MFGFGKKQGYVTPNVSISSSAVVIGTAEDLERLATSEIKYCFSSGSVTILLPEGWDSEKLDMACETAKGILGQKAKDFREELKLTDKCQE